MGVTHSAHACPVWVALKKPCALCLQLSSAPYFSLQLGEDFEGDEDRERNHTDNLATILDRLCRAKALETRGWCVSGMANLSWQKECQELLVKAGAVEASAA